MLRLTDYAKTQPHAADTIFCHRVVHQLTYFMRTIQRVSDYLKTPDDVTKEAFLPTLLDSIITDDDRLLF